MGLLTDLLGDGHGTYDRLFIDASSMSAYGGSPALGNVSSGAARGWAMDPTTEESVSFSTLLPSSWTTVDLTVYWASNGVGTGDVRWRLDYTLKAEGDLMNTGVVFPGATGTALDPADLVTTVVGSSVSVTAGDLLSVKVARDADHADDTLGVDVRMFGVLISPS